MKKFLSLFFTITVFVVFFCFEASAAETELKENSWRYKDGEAIKSEYGISLFSDPYHPDAKYKGIDVSHHQGVIDWEKVKADGIDFAIIRCGYGEDKTEYDDRCWEYNTSECERLGIPYGVYIYSYAGRIENPGENADFKKQSIIDAKSEADHVLRLIEGKNLSLPVYYDLEENSMIDAATQIDLAAVSKAFCEKIEAAGYPVGIYANLNWWTYYLTDPCFDNWYRWVARWNDYCGYEGEYAVWQYYEKGAVDGITVDVDMNFLIGTPTDHKIWSEKLATPKLNLSNDEDSGKPHLSWNKVTGAKEYQIWRKTTKNGIYKLYKTTKDVSFTEEGATAGKTYYYRVKAISKSNSVGDSHYSVQKYITCDLAKPAVTVSNDIATGTVNLGWNAVTGVKEYQIYRSKTGAEGSFAKIHSTTDTVFADTSALVGTQHFYKVKAIHKTAAANSESEIVSATRTLPNTTVTATNVASSGKVKLSWKKVDGAVKYEVYRSKTGKEGSFGRISTTSSTTLTNTSAQAGVLYYYKVKAIHTNPAANSGFSNTVSRVCDLAKPAFSAANNPSNGKPQLSWNAVEGAQKYEIYRSRTGNTGSFSKIYTTDKTTFTNTSAQAGEMYWYKIKAVHSNVEANSVLSDATGVICRLSQPEITLTNVASGGKIKISWNAVEGAEKYEVYRSKTGKAGSFARISTTKNTSLTNTSAQAGTLYYYKVKAVHSNPQANSEFSAAKSITCKLAAPVVKVSYAATGKPKLSWDRVDGAVKYQIYRSKTGKDGSFALINTVTGITTTNKNAVAGTKYYYKVVAVHTNTDANSAYSATVNIISK
ncbi:MAG: hypothetical protein IKA10_00545 [Oscillospiraceae bacterium]|nr:hypothetical protein [Oscillospiraceae bacterium]